MATQVGSPPGTQPILMYPDKVGLKAWLETPNPDGYTEQMGQFGTRAGTILPHHPARTSFEQLRKQKHNVATSVVSLQDPSKDNPFGGMQVLIPSFDMAGVTPEMMARAKEKAQTMTNDRMEQDVLMFRLLSDEVNGVAPKEEEPSPAPNTSVAIPPPAPNTTMPEPTPNAGVQVAGLPSSLDQAALIQLLLQQLQPRPAGSPMTPTPAGYPTPAPPAAVPAPQVPVAQPPVFLGSPQQVGPSIPTTSKLFECLGIPDLDVQPSRPKAQVNFKLGKFGSQATHYHWVLHEANALYLVFDTRYDYPVYTPPSLDPDETVEVELANVQGGSQKLTCCSCGMSFRFGVFQIFILLVPAGA